MISGLDEGVNQRILVQALKHGHSVEDEARALLVFAVAAKEQESADNAALPAAAADRFEKMMTNWESRAVDDNASPRERMQWALESLIGIWSGRGTTDELMRLTRGED